MYGIRKDINSYYIYNMENINLIELKKNFKYLSKNPKKNYNELLSLYQKLVVYYYYLKKTDELI